MRRTLRPILALTTASLLGCAIQRPSGNLGLMQPSPKDEKAGDSSQKKPDPQLAAAVLSAAGAYKGWKRVSDQAHWAPTMCRAPVAEGAQVSDSKDDTTHGRKLYYLFAKDPDAYRWLPQRKGESPVGQALVKEAWVPVEVDPATVPTTKDSFGQPTHPPEYAFADGKAYKTGAAAPLFVMVKLDPKTPGTDQGWVYGAVSADRKSVIDAGRIASCMGCHTKTEHDRLFGPPWLREQEKRARKAPEPPTKPDRGG
jgi:hypothetical protein